jgi:N6-L-threonylcarbamoyladenine synthase
LRLRIDTRKGTFVQLLDANRVLAVKYSQNLRGQVEELPNLLRQVLDSPLNFTDEDGELPTIEQVEVTVGPGKYMALRSGIAFAKGLAKALSVPIVGISDTNEEVPPLPVYDNPPNVTANIPAPIVQLRNSVELELNKVSEPEIDYIIVPATVDDLEFISHTEQELFGDSAWNAETIRQTFESDNNHYYIVQAVTNAENRAENGTTKAGAVCISAQLNNQPSEQLSKPELRQLSDQLTSDQSYENTCNSVAELVSVAIIPQFQRKGAAFSSLLTICELLQQRGCGELHLEVRESNTAARKLYDKLGFEVLRARPKYYRNPTEDAVVMRKILQPRAASPIEQPVIIGIETTCDETGVGITFGANLAGDALASSMDLHVEFGGVIPEIASRAHLKVLDDVLDQAVTQAGLPDLKAVTAVAVSAAPGLLGCLATGVAYAKGLAFGLDVPLYGVNHVVGHILAAQIEYNLPPKFLSLIVSGGHTALVLVNGLELHELGSTLDDAAGEAFDKVGRMLGLDYPAGAKIDQLAKLGNPQAIKFPQPLVGVKFQDNHKYDFSFSGLKTAAIRELERQSQFAESERVSREDFCASFAQTVAQVLTTKVALALEEYEVDTVVIGGGFSANSQLRNLLGAHCDAVGKTLIAPALKFCTDNGAMVANLGYQLYSKKFNASGLDFSPLSNLGVDKVLINS